VTFLPSSKWTLCFPLQTVATMEEEGKGESSLLTPSPWVDVFVVVVIASPGVAEEVASNNAISSSGVSDTVVDARGLDFLFYFFVRFAQTSICVKI